MGDKKAYDPLEIKEPRRWLMVILAVLFIAIAITMALAATWAYRYQRDMVALKAMNTLATTAFFETQALKQWSKTSKAGLKKVAATPELQDYFQSKGAFPLVAFQKSLEEQGFFAGCLTDRQGIPIEVTWAGNAGNFPDAYLKQPARVNAKTASWRILKGETGITTIECCLPLVQAAGPNGLKDEASYFLVALSSNKPLIWLQVYSKSHKSEKLFLCEKDNDKVNIFSPAEEMRLIAIEHPGRNSPASLAVSGETMQGEEEGDNGQRFLYATSYEAYTQWGLVLHVQEVDVLQPMKMTFTLLWSLVLALMFLLIGAFVFIWRQQHLKTVREANKMLQNMLQRILETQEIERASVSRDLHDGMCQYLDATLNYLARLSMDTEGTLPDRAAKALEKAKECVRDAARISRATIGRLRPEVLQSFGIATALDDMQYTWTAPPSLVLDIKEEKGSQRFPIESEEHLYRIAQEALQNAKKHAKAEKVTLRYRQTQERSFLEIIDNGKGMDHPENPSKPSFGISIIKERARILGAALQITSSDQGTRVRVDLPLGALDHPQAKNCNSTDESFIQS